MKTITLSGKNANGKSVKVDDDDFEKYSNLKWHLSDTGYAVRRKDGETYRLHRLIMNCPENLIVDHLNGDRLDCRKSNLRVCTQKENCLNRHNAKGYCFDKTRGQYIVRYRKQFWGRYDTEDEAKKAVKLAKSGQEYHKARRKYFMLPRHISKQFGKYRVGIQIDGRRYRKTGFDTIDDAVKWRDKLYKTLGKGG